MAVMDQVVEHFKNEIFSIVDSVNFRLITLSKMLLAVGIETIFPLFVYLFVKNIICCKWLTCLLKKKQ
jgi:hypothetical protein